MNNPGEHMENPSAYEMSDASVGWVTLIGIGSTLLILVIVIGLFSYFASVREAIYQEQVLRPVSAEVLEFRRVQDSVINSYELIDSATGTYRIPISRAMELIADEVGGTPTGD